MGICKIVIYSNLPNNLQEFKNIIIIAQHTENQILSSTHNEEVEVKDVL